MHDCGICFRINDCSCRSRVEAILQWCDQNQQYQDYALLFLLAYIFLLRLPSEALPATAGKDQGQASLYMEGQALTLVLKRRKNKPQGSKLVRTCWCNESPVTCPVHAFGPMLERCVPGQKLFEGITPAGALGVLRSILFHLGVQGHDMYRTHDLRRGHALDLQQSGAPLYAILSAGEWKSPAFLEYLNIEELEREAVVQAHVDESDEDESV